MQKRYRINNAIKSSPIRVIGEDGQNFGVLEIQEALILAQEKALDLIEISHTANPPVCRIMDFGKFKYQRERGEREHGKKQKEVEVKEIRIGFLTGKHDLEIRAKQAEKFISEGNKVRVSMRLAGRQKAHANLAMEKFNEFLQMVSIGYSLEAPPKKMPQGISAIIIKK